MAVVLCLLQTGCLGHGTFGIVIKALDLRSDPPTEVAIKLLPRGDFVSTRCLVLSLQIAPPFRVFERGTVHLQVKNYQLYVRREIQNQSSLRHPLIVSLREVSVLAEH
jgi:serine/threonine protein kinase